MKKTITFIVISFWMQILCAINPVSHEYVDLGLPSHTLWATCNIGADNPYDNGSYFAWGETVGNKNAYNESTYKFYTNGGSRILKYDITDNDSCDENAMIENRTSLKSEDDAASINWGEEWCTPSVEQYEELLKNCTIVEKKVKRHNGLLITGPSGSSIFLPLAGVYYKNNKLYQGEEGYYWTKDLSPKVPSIAAFLHLKRLEIRYQDRYNGFPIRPVRKQ